MKLGLAILIAILGSTPAWGQSQSELNRSASESFKRADADLNRVYQRVLNLTDPAERKVLVTAQRAWIKFRDSSCDHETSANREGSVYPMIHAMCVERMTVERTSQLKGYVACPEGALDCPLPR